MVNGITDIGNVSKVTNASMKSYMDALQNQLKELNPDNNVLNTTQSGQINELLKGSISQTQINNDPELANDLKILEPKKNETNFDTENSNKLNIDEISSDKISKSFSNIFNNYIKDVNKDQIDADNAVETFSSGGNIEMHSVMIAAEKASASMQLTLQLRNKFLQAYQEISKMQV